MKTLSRRLTFSIPLFNEISDTSRRQLEDVAFVRLYKKNEMIIANSSLNKYLFYINFGLVKLYRETNDGNEFILEMRHEKNYIGLFNIFDENSNQTSLYSALAITDTQLVGFPLKTIKHLFLQDCILTTYFLKISLNAYKNSSLTMEHNSLKTTVERIGCFILRLCPANSTGSITIELPYDKQNIAVYLGMKPESFSRGLAKLCELTDISVKNNTIHIPSVDTFSKNICPTCSLRFTCTQEFNIY